MNDLVRRDLGPEIAVDVVSVESGWNHSNTAQASGNPIAKASCRGEGKPGRVHEASSRLG